MATVKIKNKPNLHKLICHSIRSRVGTLPDGKFYAETRPIVIVEERDTRKILILDLEEEILEIE